MYLYYALTVASAGPASGCHVFHLYWRRLMDRCGPADGRRKLYTVCFCFKLAPSFKRTRSCSRRSCSRSSCRTTFMTTRTTSRTSRTVHITAPQGGAGDLEGSDGPGGGSGGPGGGSGGPGGHWASSAMGEISNPHLSEAGSIFPGTPNINRPVTRTLYGPYMTL